MDTVLLMQQLLMLFAMMMTGFVCYRKGLMNDGFNKTLSTLVVNVFNPAIVISSAMGKRAADAGSLVAQNLTIAVVYFLVIIAISYPIMRLIGIPKQERKMYRVLFDFSNYGFMGIPLVSGMFGSSAVIFVAFYMLLMTILFYTYGIATLRGSFNLRKLLNPGTIAGAVAILLFLSGLQVPDCVSGFFSYMGNVCIPVPMMLVGASLAKTDLKKLLTNWAMYKFAVVKMLVVPIAMVLVVRRLPIDPVLIGVFMLMACMPIASVPTLAVQEYGTPEESLVASQLTALTTLVCLGTVPIVSLFL